MTHAKYLCPDSLCPMCGGPCDRYTDHEGQHHCINCGCRWTEEGFLDEGGPRKPEKGAKQ